MNEKYQLFINEIWILLHKHGINKQEMVAQLKLECEEALKAHKEKYHRIRNSVIDMFVGVPLGALVASIIYSESNITPTKIASIILIGLTISVLVKLISNVRFYSEGYFKDKYLLDVLNELNYYESSPAQAND